MSNGDRYIATCWVCGDSVSKDGSAPRERFCKCGTWVPYVLRIETLSSVIASASDDTNKEGNTDDSNAS